MTAQSQHYITRTQLLHKLVTLIEYHARRNVTNNELGYLFALCSRLPIKLKGS